MHTWTSSKQGMLRFLLAMSKKALSGGIKQIVPERAWGEVRDRKTKRLLLLSWWTKASCVQIWSFGICTCTVEEQTTSSWSSFSALTTVNPLPFPRRTPANPWEGAFNRFCLPFTFAVYLVLLMSPLCTQWCRTCITHPLTIFKALARVAH